MRRSPATVIGSGAPVFAIALAAAARLSADIAASTVCAPLPAKAAAMARPMPRLPPVTTTTFPLNSASIRPPAAQFAIRYVMKTIRGFAQDGRTYKENSARNEIPVRRLQPSARAGLCPRPPAGRSADHRQHPAVRQRRPAAPARRLRHLPRRSFLHADAACRAMPQPEAHRVPGNRRRELHEHRRTRRTRHQGSPDPRLWRHRRRRTHHRAHVRGRARSRAHGSRRCGREHGSRSKACSFSARRSA